GGQADEVDRRALDVEATEDHAASAAGEKRPDGDAGLDVFGHEEGRRRLAGHPQPPEVHARARQDLTAHRFHRHLPPQALGYLWEDALANLLLEELAADEEDEKE